LRKSITLLLALTLFLLSCSRQIALGEEFEMPLGNEQVSVKGTGLSIRVKGTTESYPGGFAATLKITLNGAEQTLDVKEGGTVPVGDYNIKLREATPQHVILSVTRR
jgi:hypothetical protein